jgi:hypothetical protein
MGDVTRILASIDSGDAKASELLLPMFCDVVRKAARSRLHHEQPGHALLATYPTVVQSRRIEIKALMAATHKSELTKGGSSD